MEDVKPVYLYILYCVLCFLYMLGKSDDLMGIYLLK